MDNVFQLGRWDIFRANLEPANVAALSRLVERRMADQDPRGLVVVEDDDRAFRVVRRRLADVSSHSQLILATSGTSSTNPHLVGLSWDALAASARETNGYLGASGWLLALPTHHVAGFQILVRSALLGTSPLVASRTEQIADHLERIGTGIAASLVPTQLRGLLGQPLDRLHAILVGGARLPGELARSAKQLPIVTTYGMTETAGGCVYDGTPLPNALVRIEDGRILLGGTMLMDGYVGEESPLVHRGGQRFLVTNDLGAWTVDGKLIVLGRADDVIISGGENLSPAAIEDAIQARLPEVEVAVLGIADMKWGEAVCAAIAGSPQNADELGPIVRQAVATRLGKKSAPRRVVVMERLPLLPTGKVDLQTLRRQVLEAVETHRYWSAD